MTTIEWTDQTWNPVTGCTKVSQGCKNCYAEKVFPRPYGRDQWPVGDGTFRRRLFTDIECHEGRVAAPLSWKRPRRVFVNSMSDLFHEDVPDEFVEAVFGAMGRAPQHKYQVLTKRPERMRKLLGQWKARGWMRAHDYRMPRNVWLGVSVEDQATADERIPLLLQTPAAVRWVSYEPALGPVDFTEIAIPERLTISTRACINVLTTMDDEHFFNRHAALDWVVVGGESGPGARPFDVAWARSTVEQCKTAGVPVFVKQLGARPYEEGCEVGSVFVGRNPASLQRIHDRKGGDMSEWPEDLRVREWPCA